MGSLAQIKLFVEKQLDDYNYMYLYPKTVSSNISPSLTLSNAIRAIVAMSFRWLHIHIVMTVLLWLFVLYILMGTSHLCISKSYKSRWGR